jgi:hypothetical protein
MALHDGLGRHSHPAGLEAALHMKVHSVDLTCRLTGERSESGSTWG